MSFIVKRKITIMHKGHNHKRQETFYSQ